MILYDVYARGAPSRFVSWRRWPITALYTGPLGWFIYARAVFAGLWAIAGAALAGVHRRLTFAWVLKLLFQYFAIKPMSGLAPREALARAIGADTLTVVAFELGCSAGRRSCSSCSFPTRTSSLTTRLLADDAYWNHDRAPVQLPGEHRADPRRRQVRDAPTCAGSCGSEIASSTRGGHRSRWFHARALNGDARVGTGPCRPWVGRAELRLAEGAIHDARRKLRSLVRSRRRWRSRPGAGPPGQGAASAEGSCRSARRFPRAPRPARR